MNLELTPDEEALQEGVRRFCEGRVSMGRVRKTEPLGGVDRELWRELAETGVFALRLPESDGGAGLGGVEAALVFEELGRALVPGPLVASHLAAGMVEGAGTGERVVGVVDLRGRAATRSPGQRPVVVDHLGHLDDLVALTDEGLSLVDPGDLEATRVETPLDPLVPLWRVDTIPDGTALGDTTQTVRWHTEGALLTAAFLVGIALATTELGVAYAKERHQFGRPIGSFQAVKHLLADMLARAEVARAAVYSAAAHVDDPDVGDVGRAVSSAKVMAGEAAVENGKSCVQVHGGMGFTWEVDAHLYLKRAWVLDTAFGSRSEHESKLGALIGGYPW